MSFHRGGTIHDINKQIGSLDASLTAYDTPTRLVVDKCLKKHGLQLEEEDEEFGYGRLQIDYKLPKQSVRVLSNKGTVWILVHGILFQAFLLGPVVQTTI